MPRPSSNSNYRQSLELRPLSASADALSRIAAATTAASTTLKYAPKTASVLGEYKALVANLSAQIMASVQSGVSQLQMCSRLAMLNAAERLDTQAKYIGALHERTVRQIAARMEKHHGIRIQASGPSPIEEKFKPGPARTETLPLDKVTKALEQVNASRPEVVAALWGQFGSTVSGWWADAVARQSREIRAISMQLAMPSVQRKVPSPPSDFYRKLYDSKRRLTADLLMQEDVVELPYRVLTLLKDEVDLSFHTNKVETALAAFATPDLVKPLKEAGVKIDTSSLHESLLGSYAVWLTHAQAGRIQASIPVEVPVLYKTKRDAVSVSKAKGGYSISLSASPVGSAGVLVGKVTLPDHIRRGMLDKIVASVKESGVTKQHDYSPVSDLAGMLDVALALHRPIIASSTVASGVDFRVEARHGEDGHVAVFMRVVANTTVNHISAGADTARSAKTRLSLATLLGTPETNLKMANSVLNRPGSSLEATTSFPEHKSDDGDVTYAICMGFAIRNADEVVASEHLFNRVIEDLCTISRLVGTEESSADCPENRQMIEDFVSSRGATSVARVQAGGKRLVVVNPSEYRSYEVINTRTVKGTRHYTINVNGTNRTVSGSDWTEKRV